MAALLDNGSVVHYKDALRVPNGGEAMRDDEAGPAPHQCLHGLLYLQFGAGVSTGSGLVQNQNGRIRQNRPSDGHQLLMCADSGYAFLIQNAQGREQKEQVHLSDRSGRELADGIMKPLAEAEGGGVWSIDRGGTGCVSAAVSQIRRCAGRLYREYHEAAERICMSAITVSRRVRRR